MHGEDIEDLQKCFEIKCKKCGHVGVNMDDTRDVGTEDTGPFGSMTIVCGNAECHNEYDIVSY